MNCLTFQMIKVTLTFSEAEDEGGAAGNLFSFIISDVVNPPSTAPTSPFSNILLTDENAYGKLQYTETEVTVQTSIAGVITAATLVQSNSENGSNAQYTFTLTTKNRVPVGSSFVIEYPSDVSVYSTEVCKVTVV